MLPKEDCVLSIRFFFGGVLGGGLMVTMLPRGARRRGAADSAVGGFWQPATAALALLVRTAASPQLSKPTTAARLWRRRAGGTPFVKLVNFSVGPEPVPVSARDRRPLFGAGPTRPPEASPPSDATASEMGRGWPWQ